MLDRFLHWLFTPPPDDEIKRLDINKILRAILIFTSFLSTIAILMGVVFRAENWQRLTRDGLLALSLTLVLWVLHRRGHTRLASIGIIFGFVALAALTGFTGVGVRGTAYPMFILVIIVSALFFPGVGVYIVATISSLLGLLMLLAHREGLMPNAENPLPETATWVIISGYFYIAAVVLNLALRQIDRAIAQANQELQERKKAEQEIRRLNLDLEDTIARRTAQLAAREEQYRLISMITSDYVFSTEILPGGELNHQWVSGAFEPIMGMDFDEFIAGGGWRAVVHPDDLDADDRSMDRLRRNEKTVSDVRIIQKDGSIRWVRTFGHPLWDEEHDRLKGIYGGVQDITDQKRFDEQEKTWIGYLEKVIELGKNITAAADLEDCFREIHTSVNKGLGFDRVGVFDYDEKNNMIHGTFGTSRTGQIEDTSWYALNADDFSAWQVVLSDPMAVINITDYQETNHVPEDSEMYGLKQHVTVAAWAGGRPVALISVDNLISQRPITGMEIKALQLFAGYAGLAVQNARMQEDLEQRVRERTRELEAANQELESFSYTIAHDLRTPTRGVTGFVQLLRQNLEGTLDQTSQHYLNHITTESARLGQMIDALLEYLRLGRVRLDFQTVELTRLVRAVAAGYDREISARSIRLTLNPLPAVNGDLLMLRKVFASLLENAIKFTRKTENPEIELGFSEESGEPAFYIRDNGVGFNMAYAEKLFGVFQRLHHVEEYEGVGIGLAIVQRILKRHGGRIWLDSEEGHGTTFYFTIPSVIETTPQDQGAD